MADNPNLSVYCVSLFFEGATRVAMTVAGSEAEAMAHVSVQAAREHDHPLLSIGILRLEPEWMRFALRTLESGGPPKATVVSLVSDNLRPYEEILGSLGQQGERVSPVSDNQAPPNRNWCHQHNHTVPCPTCLYSPSQEQDRVPRCLQHGSAIPCPACTAEQIDRYRHLMPTEAPDPA